MIIDTAPANEAIISNVAEISEFKIRASSKSFQILSSGLYQNKIRAIIRELSTNAVDSHVAACRPDAQFDVHLPNQLEGWFSIRDYGTGLSRDQVSKIYTTYFESTKTDSNDFIGALGLGSKTPFSYTDNFTVTAIQNGVKGIYSAFINDTGVPSIALMQEEESTDPAGVEIKFAVHDYKDFWTFAREAELVYAYFKIQPVVYGSSDFKVHKITYIDRDIIPGVHTTQNCNSTAVMGNIAYPINFASSDTTLGDLASLLSCGLEMHFDIGELDFQASREGLSYIPQTINAIKTKLELVNANLANILAGEVAKIKNEWDRAIFLEKRISTRLWKSAAIKYCKDTTFPLINIPTSGYGISTKTFRIPTDELTNDFNITIRAFSSSFSRSSARNLRPSTHQSDNRDATGSRIYYTAWNIAVHESAVFVTNATKIGAFERAKHHIKNSSTYKNAYYTVYVIEAKDKTKPPKFDEFFAHISSPPTVIKSDALLAKPREPSNARKNVTIVKLDETGSRYYNNRQKVAWRDAGEFSKFSDSTEYYYLPLSGYEIISKFNTTDIEALNYNLSNSGIDKLSNIKIYGVRKGDIETIKQKSNWINLEDHIASVLSNGTHTNLVAIIINQLDSRSTAIYHEAIASKITNKNSPYLTLTLKFKGYNRTTSHTNDCLTKLFGKFAPALKTDPVVFKNKIDKEVIEVNRIYPLISQIYMSDSSAIAHYINLVDASNEPKK